MLPSLGNRGYLPHEAILLQTMQISKMKRQLMEKRYIEQNVQIKIEEIDSKLEDTVNFIKLKIDDIRDTFAKIDQVADINCSKIFIESPVAAKPKRVRRPKKLLPKLVVVNPVENTENMPKNETVEDAQANDSDDSIMQEIFEQTRKDMKRNTPPSLPALWDISGAKKIKNEPVTDDEILENANGSQPIFPGTSIG